MLINELIINILNEYFDDNSKFNNLVVYSKFYEKYNGFKKYLKIYHVI